MKKKALSILLALVMCLSLLPTAALAANDLNGHWAEDVITQWQEKGWVSGYGDGTFRPNAPVTRAAFVKLMNQALGFTEEAAIAFSDITEDDWCYHEVARAVSAGYTQGYGDGSFRPGKNITRAEAAVMIAKALGLTAQETYADGFSDEIPAWAKGSIGAVAAAGFMTGYTDGTFRPNATITRAAAVVSLDRVTVKAQGTTTITEPGTTLEDKIIAGDLIVAESVGDGNVYLKNVTVVGETYIRGGGSHSFYAENSRFSGTVYMQKNRLHMDLSGTTEIGNMQMEKPSSITFEKGFSGSVKDLTIPEGAPEGKYSIEAEDKDSTPVENVNLDAKADLSLGANVSRMTVGENAKDSSITVEKDATVDNLEVNSKAEITGKGTVGSMDVGASGVTTAKDLTVKDTTTSNGAAAPTTKPSSSSSSGGSSSGGGYTRPTVTFEPSTYGFGSTSSTTMKHVSFRATGAALTRDDLIITVKSEKAGITTPLEESATGYTLTVSNSTITVEFPGFQVDTKYTVEIKASAAGSAKYNITAYTFKYDGLNKLTWQTATEGIADIIPGQEITAGNAKVTFTVDGATTKNSSEAITAKLKGSSAESPEISIDSEKITTVRGTKTITVDLSGNTLSADTYTLTLSVPADRLERDIERYITETNTTAVTFEVTTKEVTLGTPTPTSTTFTSGTALPVGGYTITFPVTGIASLSSDEGKKPTATITPAAEGAATVDGITATVTAESVEGSVSNVVVTLTGTPIATEDTEYTLTLTIPAAGITVKTGYADPTAALTQTFTFKVTTTTPITATSGRENTLVATQGETLPDNTKLTVEVTGASDMTINGIQVIAFQGDAEAAFTIDTEKTTFTSPTGDNKTGTLTITLKGTAPILSTTATGATRENGLKVVIPQAAFTPMDGYTVPTGGITVNDFKAVLNPATSAGA